MEAARKSLARLSIFQETYLGKRPIQSARRREEAIKQSSSFVIRRAAEQRVKRKEEGYVRMAVTVKLVRAHTLSSVLCLGTYTIPTVSSYTSY